VLPCLWWLITERETFDSSQKQYSPLCKFGFCQCIFLWNAPKLIASLRHLSSIRECKQVLKKQIEKCYQLSNYLLIIFRSITYENLCQKRKNKGIYVITCTILKDFLKVFNILLIFELMRLLSQITNHKKKPFCIRKNINKNLFFNSYKEPILMLCIAVIWVVFVASLEYFLNCFFGYLLGRYF